MYKRSEQAPLKKIHTVKKHMGRCETPYITKELQISATVIYITTRPEEWPKSKTPTTPNAGEDTRERERSFVAGGM